MKRILSGLAIVLLGACGGGDGPGNNAVDCSRNNGGCLADAYCAMVSGLPVCTCKPGFVGDGVTACNVLLTVSSPQDGLVISGSAPASVLVSGTTNGAVSLEYTLDGGAPVSVSINQNAFAASIPVAEEDGVQHSVEITAKDASGQSSTVARRYMVDRIAPRVAITSPGIDAACEATCTGAVINLSSPSPYPLSGTIEEGGEMNPTDGLVASIDGQPVDVFLRTGAWSASWANVPEENGREYVFSIVAKDSAGNTSTAARKVYVDRVAPGCVAPQNGKRFVSRTATLLQCSELMDEGAVQNAVDSGGEVLPSIGSIDGMRFGFSNPAVLKPYQVYSMSLGVSAKDRAGNSLRGPVAQSFLTEPVWPQAQVRLDASAYGLKMALNADELPSILYLEGGCKPGDNHSGQSVRMLQWDGKGEWRRLSLAGFFNPACEAEACLQYSFDDFRVFSGLRGLELDDDYRAIVSNRQACCPWTRKELLYASSVDSVTWVVSAMPKDGLCGDSVIDFSLESREASSVVFCKEGVNESGVSYFDFGRVKQMDRDSADQGWLSAFDVMNADVRHHRSGAVVATAGGEFRSLPSYVQLPFGFSDYSSLEFGAGRYNASIINDGASVEPGFLIWSENAASQTELALKIACSAQHAAASAWYDSAAINPIPASSRIDNERVRSILTSQGRTVVGLAMLTDRDRAVFGTVAMGTCQGAPSAPSWQPPIDQAISPDIAVGAQGKVWRTWIDKATHQIVITH